MGLPLSEGEKRVQLPLVVLVVRIMSAIKIAELRDMSVDQLEATLKEAKEKLFHLRLQARMERLDSPSELKKNKRLIARILTLKSLRKLQKETITQ